MKKIKKILTIREEKIHFTDEAALKVQLNNIRHTPVHYHSNSLELIYCVKGYVDILCNHETVRLMPNEIFSVDYEDLHCIYSDSDNLVIQIHLNMNSLSTSREYLENVYFACQDAGCQSYQREALEKVKNLVLATAYKYAQKTLQKQEIKGIANQFTNTFLSNFDWFNYLDMYPNQNELLRQRIQRILAYCMKHYTEKITISHMADLVHIDKNYFSQFMRKSPYGSFSSMMGYIRCYHAQYMMLETEYSITEVAYRCGFSDEKYLYKNFHSWWGKTPTEHRRWFKKYITAPDNIQSIPESEAIKILSPFIALHFVNNNINS
ncbi:MAG: AraC family transcriptional regulator [Clostridiales bacterium]|nr:AraC family transcriptional regulator [Clostridiales bacterium]